MLQIDDVLKEFRGRFIGKSSPVHFFWGAFDLAVSRFNGRRAPERPGADRIQAEGYSHEVISAGFWPGGGPMLDPAFYAYAGPSLRASRRLPSRPPRRSTVQTSASSCSNTKMSGPRRRRARRCSNFFSQLMKPVRRSRAGIA